MAGCVAAQFGRGPADDDSHPCDTLTEPGLASLAHEHRAADEDLHPCDTLTDPGLASSAPEHRAPNVDEIDQDFTSAHAHIDEDVLMPGDSHIDPQHAEPGLASSAGVIV